MLLRSALDDFNFSSSRSAKSLVWPVIPSETENALTTASALSHLPVPSRGGTMDTTFSHTASEGLPMVFLRPRYD